jgi:hypothetical protein
MSWTDRDPARLSPAEIRDILTREFCGLPPPAEGAPLEEFHKYLAAGFFLLFCHEAKNAGEGKVAATNFLLVNEKADLEHVLPHIESALGRKLNEQELAKGRIEAV